MGLRQPTDDELMRERLRSKGAYELDARTVWDRIAHPYDRTETMDFRFRDDANERDFEYDPDEYCENEDQDRDDADDEAYAASL